MCRSLRAPTKWTSSPRSPTRRKLSFARSGFSLSKLTRKLLLCCPPCAIRSASWWSRAPPNPPAKSLSPPATSYARSMVCPSPHSTVCAASSKTSRPAVPSRFKFSAKTGSFLSPSHSTSPDHPVVMYIGGFQRALLWNAGYFLWGAGPYENSLDLPFGCFTFDGLRDVHRHPAGAGSIAPRAGGVPRIQGGHRQEAGALGPGGGLHAARRQSLRPRALDGAGQVHHGQSLRDARDFLARESCPPRRNPREPEQAGPPVRPR